MSIEPSPADAPKPEPAPGALVEPTWEIVLEKAASAPPPQLPPPPPNPWPRRFKIAFPVLVLVAYGLYKLMGSSLPSFGSRDGGLGPDEPESLTGVAPAGEDFERVSRNRELKELVSGLEAAASRGEWRNVVAMIDRQTVPALRNHPVVRGMRALAQTRSGERGLAIEVELKELDAILRTAGSDHAVLLEELRAARVDQAIPRLGDWEVLRRNTDEFFLLLGSEADTPYEVTVRLKLARLYESVAEKMAEEAQGYINSDTLALREARTIYQTGLRFLVRRDQWSTLGPISSGTRPDVERLVERIRLLNQSIHGPSIPFTGNDSGTWSGKKGDPIHKAAGED